MKPVKRLQQLDFLRIFAVFLVLIHHTNALPDQYPSIFLYFVGLWRQCGWVGVDLFFVLSGFLVSGILFKEYQRSGEIGFKRFFTRRGFKIYPSFYVMTISTFIAGGIVYGNFDWNALWPEVIFVQNYLGGLWRHTWSIAVEEHFYLLLPISLILLYKNSKDRENPFRLLPALFIGTALLILIFRLLTAYYVGTGRHIIPLTHLRLDGLFFGVILSYYYHFKRPYLDIITKHPVIMMAIVVLMFVMIASFELNSFFMSTVGLSILYLGFGCLVVGFVNWKFAERLTSTRIGTALAYMGTHSYSIYLWHLPVKDWGVNAFFRMFGLEPSPMISFTVFIVGSIAVGIAAAKIIEFPVLRIRDYIVPETPQKNINLQQPVLDTGSPSGAV